MIEGVKIKNIKTWAHGRGNFREILRDDDDLLSKFGQCSITVTYPGVIKAFHWHKKQDDLWYVMSGNARVVLHDLRKDSKTSGETQEIYMGDNSESMLVLIPDGVAHGYQVLGNEPCKLMYFTTKSYNREDPDEQRIAYDDPKIGFDWTIKHE